MRKPFGREEIKQQRPKPRNVAGAEFGRNQSFDGQNLSILGRQKFLVLDKLLILKGPFSYGTLFAFS